MMSALVLLFALLLPEANLRDGDIIFQESLSSQSRAIQLATGSRYSHMGIVMRENGRWYVYEAVEPVKLTPLSTWTARGRNGHYVVKRLRDASKLTPAVLRKMEKVGKRFEGKQYDLTFEWSDTRIYCSELVWKIYRDGAGIEVGKLQKLREFDLSNPAVKKKMRERYGANVPMNEPVISPRAMFDSPLLVEVARRN
ncbi:MAG TPA: YiiX family permuted papain-like enzyme [Thermoanaerobaculia bacterium]